MNRYPDSEPMTNAEAKASVEDMASFVALVVDQKYCAEADHKFKSNPKGWGLCKVCAGENPRNKPKQP